ncbi:MULTISPECIES: FAD:protein FMN transferase [Rhodobacterales]|uniref:FAD:protein FMN transferase n=1 Tax=Rhodobacterales TaxID=204455 RepID=UPI003298B4DF
MTLSRRRFLSIAAASAALPRTAHAEIWQGRAFGAEVSITIRGEREQTQQVLAAARTVLRDIEALFSLFDPKSALSNLNREGVLMVPQPDFLAVMRASDQAYRLTNGLFDPSVQRLWHILATGGKPTKVSDTIGWNRVQFDAQQVTLGAGQALTFNGIAQGYATDKVSEVLSAHGFTDVLVNIGEHRGVGGPWRLGVQDPEHGFLGTRTLHNGAIATSSPQATPLGPEGHIIHGRARPLWSTVSVEASTATLADSLSTAMVLAPRDQIAEIKQNNDLSRVTLVDFDGNLSTL